jgi:predicted RNA-binding protein with PUA-like domain
VLFYHSSADPPGVAGTATVVREAYPDRTQFDPEDPHHDPKATEDEPRWFMVDIRFEQTFPRLVPLAELKRTPGLENMPLVQKGSRLSIMPVTREQWEIIHHLAGAD